MKNFFAHQTAAERYARGRPYFHPLVIDKIKEYLQLRVPVTHALDVGCGTGQSTVALKAIAEEVTGTDVSAEMLALAKAETGITYLEAPAEKIPLPDHTIDLLTVSLAFHWFNRADFLSEAYRLLRPSSWLIIYNNSFSGTMLENADYAVWNEQTYVVHYPTPTRNNQPFEAEDAKLYGFRFAFRESYSNNVIFTRDELASYLMTQSNVISAVEQGREKSSAVYRWLLGELETMFVESRATFPFRGSIWYLQKM